MRIAQLAPLAETVPPRLYGGTERVVPADGRTLSHERLGRRLWTVNPHALANQRKNIGNWNGVLGARIIILSNMVPEFNDSAGVIASRFITLEMTQTFFGREDEHLIDKLMPERPGI